MIQNEKFSKKNTCEFWKCFLIIWPIFCVCEESRAASTSSNNYKGAGLYLSNAKINDKATRDRCPPLNSVNDSFQTSPKATLNSTPSKSEFWLDGSSFANSQSFENSS